MNHLVVDLCRHIVALSKLELRVDTLSASHLLEEQYSQVVLLLRDELNSNVDLLGDSPK